MKMCNRISAVCILVAGLVCGQPVSANSGSVEDDIIRVLGIHNGSLNAVEIALQLQVIVDSWDATSLSTMDPTTIEILNGGQALAVPEILIGIGSMSTQFQRATDFALGKDVTTGLPTGETPLVDQWGADVIVAFGLSAGSDCGAATSYWTQQNPTYEAEPLTGLDRRGRNNAFVAVVAIDGGCVSSTKYSTNGAHEFGHILGGQHYEFLDPGTGRLNTNAKAYFSIQVGYSYPISVAVRFSALASGADITYVCGQFQGWPFNLSLCKALRRYSNTNYGGSSFNNAFTFDQTARSVANYRIGKPSDAPQCSDGIDNDGDNFVDSGGGGDSDCTSPADDTEVPADPAPPPTCIGNETPINVNGWLTNICAVNSQGALATFYSIRWFNGCEAQTDWFEVWYSQPDGAAYQRLVSVPLPSINVWVRQSNARVKIKACDSIAGCSGLSSSSFVAIPRC